MADHWVHRLQISMPLAVAEQIADGALKAGADRAPAFPPDLLPEFRDRGRDVRVLLAFLPFDGLALRHDGRIAIAAC